MTQRREVMKEKRIIPYPLRIPKKLREWISMKAVSNRRSMNAELLVLIETAKETMENKEREAEKSV